MRCGTFFNKAAMANGMAVGLNRRGETSNRWKVAREKN